MKMLTLVLCGLLAVAVLPCQGASQEGSAGIVEKIRGTVWWRRNKNAKAARLDPKIDIGRRLYPGEQLRCAPNSKIRLNFAGRIGKLRGPSTWIPIQKVNRSQSRLQQALDEYYQLGGLDRPAHSPVFSPSDDCKKIPEKFVIRWNPDSVTSTVSFVIQEDSGNENVIWRQDHVDGRSGLLAAGSLKQRLAEDRAKFGERRLKLKLINLQGREIAVSFSLLSVKSEQSLKRELAFWNGKPGRLMPHLGRASIFIRYRMDSEAAEEYEAALAAAPESRDLLIRTIQAQRKIGNFARAKELEQRLPAGTKIP